MNSLLKPKMTNGTPYGLVDLTGTVAALEDRLSISIYQGLSYLADSRLTVESYVWGRGKIENTESQVRH